MYSRKTGVLYNHTEAQKKIESFNNELREQYRKHNRQENEEPEAKPSSNTLSSEPKGTINELLTNDDLIIVGLILLLLKESSKDYLAIGLLVSLLLLGR